MTDSEIWFFLQTRTRNSYGTAAIMGNLMAESSMNPLCATGKNVPKDYCKQADNGSVDFANDRVAFGLVQWCYKTRKQGLLDYARKCGKSVGDARTQLEYLWKELQGYKTALNAVVNATNIKDASDTFMLRYENPATKTDAAKKKRADYAQKYFDKFMDGKLDEKPKGKRVYTNVGVNMRTGDSTAYAKVGTMGAGKSLEYVATSVTGWYAVRYGTGIYWVSNEFAEVKDG